MQIRKVKNKKEFVYIMPMIMMLKLLTSLLKVSGPTRVTAFVLVALNQSRGGEII